MVTLCPYLYILHQIVEDRRARKDRGLLPSLRGHSWLSFVSRVVRNAATACTLQSSKAFASRRELDDADRTACGPCGVSRAWRAPVRIYIGRFLPSHTIHPLQPTWCGIPSAVGGTAVPARGGREGHRPENRPLAGADPRTGQQRAPTQEPAVATCPRWPPGRGLRAPASTVVPPTGTGTST